MQRIPKHLKKYIVPQDYSLYTYIDHSTWKFIMKISTDFFNFVEISVEKAQELRVIQTDICTEKSLISYNKKDLIINNEPSKKIDHIKIIDFDKEKLNEKIRNKMIEKKGMKNIKVRFFN